MEVDTEVLSLSISPRAVVPWHVLSLATKCRPRPSLWALATPDIYGTGRIGYQVVSASSGVYTGGSMAFIYRMCYACVKVCLGVGRKPDMASPCAGLCCED